MRFGEWLAQPQRPGRRAQGVIALNAVARMNARSPARDEQSRTERHARLDRASEPGPLQAHRPGDAVHALESAPASLLAGACVGPESHQRVNVAGVDFVSLRLAVLCAETRSLSAAARQLNLSLSAASHRLSTLEANFGSRFFERDHRGVHPTPAGAVFVQHARPILDLLRSCRMQVDILRWRPRRSHE